MFSLPPLQSSRLAVQFSPILGSVRRFGAQKGSLKGKYRHFKGEVEREFKREFICWASKRRMEPRIEENCTARQDECNGGNENARNSSEILVKCLQRQVFAKSVPPPGELIM